MASPWGEAGTTVTDEVQFTHNPRLPIKNFIISKRATTQGRPCRWGENMRTIQGFSNIHVGATLCGRPSLMSRKTIKMKKAKLGINTPTSPPPAAEPLLKARPPFVFIVI